MLRRIFQLFRGSKAIINLVRLKPGFPPARYFPAVIRVDRRLGDVRRFDAHKAVFIKRSNACFCVKSKIFSAVLLRISISDLGDHIPLCALTIRQLAGLYEPPDVLVAVIKSFLNIEFFPVHGLVRRTAALTPGICTQWAFVILNLRAHAVLIASLALFT